MARRIDPKTGVLQEEDSIFGITYWTDAKNADGKSERIDLETGIVQQESFFGWSNKEDANGKSERINIGTGVHEKEGWLPSSWKPDQGEDYSAPVRRNDPKTGVLQEKTFFGWSDILDANGNASRMNPESGVYEEQDLVCGIRYWTPKEDRARRNDSSADSPSYDSDSSPSHYSPPSGVPKPRGGGGFVLFLLLLLPALFFLPPTGSHDPSTDGSHGGSVVPKDIPGSRVSGGTTAKDDASQTTEKAEEPDVYYPLGKDGSSANEDPGVPNNNTQGERPDTYYPAVPLGPPIVPQHQLYNAPPVYIPAPPPTSPRAGVLFPTQGAIALVLDIEHDYAIPGQRNLGARVHLLQDERNIFVTLYNDVAIERGERVRIFNLDGGGIQVRKLDSE